ncbi:MAG TPA: HAMP domain-containing sensor histidine kinase [Gemmatimonadaceae bacterium]|jgi:signal transduction histidine kinase
MACTLVLATMLAYEAHEAAVSHRATAERALHDYAAVAAWELVAGINDELQTTLGTALAPITRSRATAYELLPGPSVLASGADGVLRCPAGTDSSRFYFGIDLRNGSLATAGANVSNAMRLWLADTIARHASTVYQPDWNYAVILATLPNETPIAIAYSVKYTEHRAPIAAFGIRACAGAIGASMIGDVVARRALLPVSATGGAPNDSILSISVRDPSGRPVFQTRDAAAASPYSADVAFEQVGGLTVHAAIRPRAVELLALGALPESRVPILVGLLTLTAAMVVLTVLQLRREHELSRLRSDFISSVSHELRTPLSQIMLFAETLNLGRVRTDDERHAATGVIVQEGRRLMHLVENILHFSRAERQMTRLGPEPIDLNQAVQEIVDGWMPLAASADVRLATDFAPDVFAMADRDALRQMVLNLLDNAVKYGGRPQTVTVGTMKRGDRVRVWIDDEGEGVAERDRERVWRSFYRLDRHANSAVAGSGIGLYVVRELARLHGGDTWIEDAPRKGGGARVVIELNAAPRAAGFTGEHKVDSWTGALVDRSAPVHPSSRPPVHP